MNVSITFDKDFMYLHMGGETISIELASVSNKLKNADDIQRSLYRISPSGYGIHRPLIDEDHSVELLLKVAHPRSQNH